MSLVRLRPVHTADRDVGLVPGLRRRNPGDAEIFAHAAERTPDRGLLADLAVLDLHGAALRKTIAPPSSPTYAHAKVFP